MTKAKFTKQAAAIVCVLAFVGSSGMAAADQFDLECTGVKSEAVDGAPTPHQFGVRVNLTAKKWCWDHCERVFDIHAVHPDRIVLTDDRSDNIRTRRTSTTEVSRITGDFRLLSIILRPVAIYRKIEGACTKVPFSGFPEAKF